MSFCLAPYFLSSLIAASTLILSMFPKATLALLPIVGDPDSKASFTIFVSFFLSFCVVLLKILLKVGNSPSIILFVSLAMFCALFTSADLLPIVSLSNLKNVGGFLPRALKEAPTLSSILSIASSDASIFLPLFAIAFIVVPIPPIKPVNKAPSVPNLTLFTKSLVTLSSLLLSNSVGPPTKSPKVPMVSTSATKTPSATPLPNVPAPKALSLSFLVNFVASILACRRPLASRDFLSKLKYFLAFFALIALLAKLAPLVKAIPPGTPIPIKVSVILPAAVASAFSSKIFISSKNFSTLADVFVSAPKS